MISCRGSRRSRWSPIDRFDIAGSGAFRLRRTQASALVLVLMLALVLLAAPVWSKDLPTAASVERQLTSVRTLIEKSSAARQVARVAAPDALAKQNAARELLARAEKAAAGGDHAAASSLLDDAARAMFVAIRQSAPNEVISAKQTTDLDRRVASARALQEALVRVVKEKQAGDQGQRSIDSVAEMIERAERERVQGDLAGALNSAQTAYLGAKAALSSLRGGDTLVRSLHFETPADEYRYEIDRNDTHRMLVDVLLAERRQSKGVDNMVNQFIEQAAEVRKQAEDQAARKRYDEAIDLLEQSTRSLVRAIRGAGVYIPG